MSTKPVFNACEVALQDHALPVQGLWQRNLSGLVGEAAERKLRLGYVQNPAGAGLGFLLREQASETLAGVICLHRRSMFLGSTPLRAGNLADFAVDGAYRSLGPALILMKKAVSASRAHLDVLYALPNRNSAAVCKRAGLVSMGHFQRYARVLSSRHPRVQALPLRWRALSSSLVDIGLAASDWLSRQAGLPKLTCRSIAFDSPVIDALWARRTDKLLLSERSSTMLKWRYGSAERGDWHVVAAGDKRGEVRGLVVWRLQGEVAEIGDFFSIDPTQHTGSLLRAFCIYARRRHAHSVTLEYFGTRTVETGLQRAGFRLRDAGQPVVHGEFSADRVDLNDREHWYLTSYDNDDN